MRALLLPAGLLLVAAAPIPSTPDLGKAEGQCRANESGPAFLVNPVGMKDRTGNLKIEVYPATKKDFLEDDNILVMQGKTFSRVEVPASSSTPICIRVPRAGTYAVSVLHDRDKNRKFGWKVDGIGFSSNPKLGWGKPNVKHVATRAGSSPTTIDVVMNYRSGLGVAPLKR
ncbi:DUF2141 domain-containing protein [Altererythrobacter sp. FM1]|uniref:DUF2141 domain-containing protein n=1 Tax=Tsuneonella flava TaxID=2055955 RepID=A0ABX7KBQ7_9SPHN|nr:DUF2141 domain-containing protein [Tsuneonella flava]QSB44782.1 DUF2141 domain-containing protein [Tsuneonella flava]ROT96505.1 DUF2141 domain-containing protein [Altererythrobacter sp. FM1]